MSSIPLTLTKGATTLLELTEEMKTPLMGMYHNLKLFLKAIFPTKKGEEIEKLTQTMIQTFYVQTSLAKIVFDGKDKGLSLEEIAQFADYEGQKAILTAIGEFIDYIKKQKGSE